MRLEEDDGITESLEDLGDSSGATVSKVILGGITESVEGDSSGATVIGREGNVDMAVVVVGEDRSRDSLRCDSALTLLCTSSTHLCALTQLSSLDRVTFAT